MTIKYQSGNRITGLSSDTVDIPTFSDPMTSAWTNIEGSNVVVGSGLLNYDQGTSDHGAYKDTGSSLSNTFVSRFKWNVDALSEGSDNANNEVNICISSNVGDNGTYNDAVGLMLRVDSGQTTLLFGIWDNATPAIATPTVNETIVEPLTTGVYYVEIVRRSNRIFTLRIYTDSGYTTLLYSPITLINSADLVALRYLKVMTNNETDADSTNNGSIDDWDIYDAKTSLSSKPTNVSTNSQFIETDTRNTFYYDGTSWQQPRFENMYEVFGSPKAKNRQHFVEWFSGKALDSIWSTGRDSYNSGIPTFAMDDSVDGGFKVIAEASINNSSGGVGSASSYGGNNIRQYSPYGSVYIDVFKHNTVSSGHKVIAHGLKETMSGDGAGNNTAIWGSGVNMNQNYFMSRTCGSSGGQTDVVSDVAYDQNWHSYKIETKSASVEFTFDGVLKTNHTNTTNLPASKMAPTNGVQGTSDSTAPSYSIRYVECYNT